MANKVNEGKSTEASINSLSETGLRQTEPKSNQTYTHDLIIINNYETGRNSHTSAEIQAQYRTLVDRGLTKDQLQRLGQLWIWLVIFLRISPFHG